MRFPKWLSTNRAFMVMILTLSLGVIGVSAYAGRAAGRNAANLAALQTAATNPANEPATGAQVAIQTPASAAVAESTAKAKPTVSAKTTTTKPTATTTTQTTRPRTTTSTTTTSRATNTVLTADGKSLSYRGMLSMVATAYDATYDSNGDWGPVCALDGSRLRPGMIAVDPKVIPLGSKVYVTGYTHPALPFGGFVGIAADTGGAIKGNRIDIYMEASPSSVSAFGFQTVKVYILK